MTRRETGRAKPTIIVLAVKGDSGLPRTDDVIYFEIPAALGQIQSVRAEVHLYVFDEKPASAAEALRNLGRARLSLWCQTLGLEKERGGVEVEQVFGGPLAWERLDAKTASRIATYRDGRMTAPPDELESISEWAAATLVRLYGALRGPVERAVAERDRQAEAS